MSNFTRRDFLKLGSALSGALAILKLAPRISLPRSSQTASVPNILIFVFDAMSAKNLSLYGYRRKTTPNLERFAARSTVYNQHYSAGNFTTPGTASLLTGLYPWTHRAINFSGLIARSVVDRNLFRMIGSGYHRLAFSQNIWVNYFFGQFQHDIEKILSPASFSLVNAIVGDKFPFDLTESHRAFDDFLFQDGAPPASLVFGLAERILLRRAVARAPAENYRHGLPRPINYPIFFQLSDVFDGLKTTVAHLPRPSLAYLHTLPPHAPYRPSKDFDNLFADGWRPAPKPDHTLSQGIPQEQMNTGRQKYDQFVANEDAEFGRLMDFLNEKGLLDQSYVIVTSDHGEFFERGVVGHSTPLLYDPVVRVPLLISSPGQSSRQDVNIPTSSVDVLPTLVQLSGGAVPDGCEGQVLPALGGVEEPERSIFMMDAKKNPAFASISKASFAMRKGRFKLIYYQGVGKIRAKHKFEMYDIDNDPDELNDLFTNSLGIAGDLRAELLAKVEAENAKYQTQG